jgi:hypothetical protein
MRLSFVAKSLLILGALVGSAAGLALALGLRLDQLPPWMITVGMYKLAFLAAAGLFVAGAVLGRATRRASPSTSDAETSSAAAPPAVGAGPWQPEEGSVRHADREVRDRRQN